MKKAIISAIVAIAIVMSMTSCSISSNGNGGITINPSFEIGNSDYNRNEWTVKLEGDEWTKYGIGTGSSVKFRLNSYGATADFDLRLDLSKTTRDAVVEEMTDFMKNYLGVSGDAIVSSNESWTNNSRLKFTLNFRF